MYCSTDVAGMADKTIERGSEAGIRRIILSRIAWLMVSRVGSTIGVVTGCLSALLERVARLGSSTAVLRLGAGEQGAVSPSRHHCEICAVSRCQILRFFGMTEATE